MGSQSRTQLSDYTFTFMLGTELLVMLKKSIGSHINQGAF